MVVSDRGVIAIWSSSVIFFIVLFRSSFLVIAQSVVAFSSLVVVLMILVSVIALKLHRSSQPVAGLTVVALASVMCVLMTSLVFRSLPVLSSVPVVSWSGRAIIAARRMDSGAFAMFTSMVLGSGVVLLLLGRRIA